MLKRVAQFVAVSIDVSMARGVRPFRATKLETNQTSYQEVTSDVLIFQQLLIIRYLFCFFTFRIFSRSQKKETLVELGISWLVLEEKRNHTRSSSIMTNTLNGPKLGALCKTTSWDQNIGIQKKKWKLKTKTKFAKCGFFSKSWRYIKSLFWISWNIKMHHLTLDVQHGNPCHVEVDPLDRLLQRQLRHELWRKCCCCWKLVVLPDGRSWWFASWNNSGSQPSHSCDIIFFLQGISFASYGKFSHVYLYNSSIESYYIHILDVDISSYATSTNIIFRIYLNLYTYHLTWKRSKPPTSSFRSEPPKSRGLEAAELTGPESLAKKLQEALLLAKLEDFQREGVDPTGAVSGAGGFPTTDEFTGITSGVELNFCVCVCDPGLGKTLLLVGK